MPSCSVATDGSREGPVSGDANGCGTDARPIRVPGRALPLDSASAHREGPFFLKGLDLGAWGGGVDTRGKSSNSSCWLPHSSLWLTPCKDTTVYQA